ncbi:hypothetical protein KCTC32516_02008 [Polaribacter huanghezhanensis]|uniref:hypothetical protein n=1 Tax=Polaribacter huanghezhanensis TaxID=1354726 RepID=UPI0026497F29|nr:hypothetical protein [Polaribacter huanghezhanensis]WKD86632.1 hypothetical protein KCTC32516_02008 [Polaribacter huanghezhanensis]
MSDSTNKPTTAFWIIAVVAFIWNLMGVFAYLTRAFITEEMIAALPPEQQAEFLTEQPAWVTAAFALAVFGGALGALFLLLKKKFAAKLFLISALAAIVQQIYLFRNVEMPSLAMPILIIVVCLFLVWYAKDATKKGILS